MDFIFTVINYGIMATLSAGLVFMGAACLILISRNVRQGRSLRRHIAKRAATLRMSKLLNILQIDVNEYIHATHISSINQCMNQCETCEKTAQCDATMSQSSIHMNTIAFCPILNSLTEMEVTANDAPLSAKACLAG